MKQTPDLLAVASPQTLLMARLRVVHAETHTCCVQRSPVNRDEL